MIPLLNKPNVAPADADYLYGNIQDQTMSVTGTPVNVEVYADMHQFFERMIALSSVTPNGDPDNEANGWQLYEALIDTIQSNPKALRFYVKLTQVATGAPTVVHQAENDFSTSPSWSYVAVGRYRATFGSAVFPDIQKCMKKAESLRFGASIYLSFPTDSILEVATYDVTGTLADDILANSDVYVDVSP